MKKKINQVINISQNVCKYLIVTIAKYFLVKIDEIW